MNLALRRAPQAAARRRRKIHYHTPTTAKGTLHLKRCLYLFFLHLVNDTALAGHIKKSIEVGDAVEMVLGASCPCILLFILHYSSV